MDGTEFLALFAILIFLLYKFGTRTFGHWTKRGVREMKTLPFIGNNDLAIKWGNPLEFSQKFYKCFKGERFGGFYFFQAPFLSITDPELLKLILVKDAEYFINRYDWMGTADPVFSKSLVALKDEKWKQLRTVMSTVFTSAKMKDMYKFMAKCAEQGVQYLEDKISEQVKSNHPDGDILKIEFRDFYARYGTDVIATTAFGLEVDSFKNPNNEFFSSGTAIRNFGAGWNFLKVMFIPLFPSIAKMLNMRFFSEDLNNFFLSIVQNSIKAREENNIVRKDLLHIMMEARKGKVQSETGDVTKAKIPDLTDMDITSQALFFFFGGFETIALLLGFISYELAVNPDVQEKLLQEIDEIIEKENGINYDGVVHQSKYLDMIINETLRKWPAAVMTDRVVGKTYVIPKTENSPEVVLQKGDLLWISISGFHYDPEYFPDPEKFDPERFRDEKNTIKPYTYLPFGIGPRHCIGMRFALMEAKTVLIHLLKKFIIVPIERTPIPLKVQKSGMLMVKPAEGFWLGLEPRK